MSVNTMRELCNSIKGFWDAVLECMYACVTLGWLLAIVAYKFGRKWGVMHLYNNFSALYDRWIRLMPLCKRVNLIMLKIAKPSSGMRMLDIATGTGLILIPLAKLSQISCGIDISFNILKIAKAKTKKLSLTKVEYINGDAENLCLKDELFDLVTCNLSVFFFPNQTKALQEVFRVLKPGGVFVFSTYTEIGSYFLSGQFHSAVEWKAILQKIGFQSINVLNCSWLYMIIVARKGNHNYERGNSNIQGS